MLTETDDWLRASFYAQHTNTHIAANSIEINLAEIVVIVVAWVLLFVPLFDSLSHLTRCFASLQAIPFRCQASVVRSRLCAPTNIQRTFDFIFAFVLAHKKMAAHHCATEANKANCRLEKTTHVRPSLFRFGPLAAYAQ